MKALKNLMQKTKPKKKGFLYWFWDSQYTFLFTPGHSTHGGAHIRDGVDLKRTMFMVILAMVPALLFGMFNVGHQHYLALGETTADKGLMDMFGDKFIYGLIKVLPIVIVSYASGLLIEFIFCTINKHSINEGFLVSGMLIPLCMPPDVPLWMVAVGTIFAVLIGKEVFGGTGMNILNVALTARAFMFFAYPNSMSGEVWISGAKEEFSKVAVADGYSGASALGRLAETVQDPSQAKGIMSSFADGGQYDMMNSILGTIPGSIGETSVLAIGLGALFLIFTGVGSWRIMLSMIAGGLAMGAIFNAVDANAYMGLDPTHQLLIGGFMFGAVFMATDPVTAAQTVTGKFIYGFFCGFFGIMIRVFNPAYPEGIMMAILFMNVMAPLIDHYVVQANVKRRLKRVKVKAA
jgi:Na+-transporting NADH:ubiquinone oxidoreductase subunit B